MHLRPEGFKIAVPAILTPVALLLVFAHTPPPPPKQESTAIFSLITSNDPVYVDQLRLLSRSMLHFAPEYPLHVLITDDVSTEIIAAIGAFAITKIVPAYPEPKRPMMYERWIHQFTKFKFWSFYEHQQICYMDADVAFFGRGTVQSIVSECNSSFQHKKIKLCGFESDCRNGGGDRKSWGMKYMQANFFCLRPSQTLFADITENVIEPFMHKNFVYNGKGVSTEQDIMNLYFKHGIHYLKCEPIIGGRLVHGKSENGWVEWEMVNGLY
jgi:hypothetical protein